MTSAQQNRPDPSAARVSVVIPCYNHAQYLPDAVESVLAQTFAAHEIIVVDDGSTDDTPDVAARFQPHARLIRQDNRGLSGARNTGIRHATGDFLAFLDADDAWLPDFLATLVPMLVQDASLGAVYSGCQFVDEAGRALPQATRRVVPPDQVRDTLIDGDFFPAHAVLIRKTCFDSVGLFDESLRASEDWDMWLRVSAQYKMAGTPHIVALYRMHGDNMSKGVERMHATQMAVARKQFGPSDGDAADWPSERQRAYASVYLWRALAHYQRSETLEAQGYLRRAFVASPTLAGRLDVFYMLACADQTLGSMGDLRHLNLNRGAARVEAALRAVFAAPETPARLQAQERMAYGNAYFALGLVAYGNQRPDAARAWLAQAAGLQPRLVVNRQWVTTFAKSCLGYRSAHLFRRFALWWS